MTGNSGSATLFDDVDDSNGGFVLGALTVDASGVGSATGLSAMISSRDAPIRIAGDARIDGTGDIRIVTSGTGGLDVGGLLSLSGNTVAIGDDDCRLVACPAAPAVHAGGTVDVRHVIGSVPWNGDGRIAGVTPVAAGIEVRAASGARTIPCDLSFLEA